MLNNMSSKLSLIGEELPNVYQSKFRFFFKTVVQHFKSKSRFEILRENRDCIERVY